MLLIEANEKQATALWAAASAAGHEVAHPATARDEFDQMLFAEPISRADSELRDALGVL